MSVESRVESRSGAVSLPSLVRGVIPYGVTSPAAAGSRFHLTLVGRVEGWRGVP